MLGRLEVPLKCSGRLASAALTFSVQVVAVLRSGPAQALNGYPQGHFKGSRRRSGESESQLEVHQQRETEAEWAVAESHGCFLVGQWPSRVALQQPSVSEIEAAS